MTAAQSDAQSNDLSNDLSALDAGRRVLRTEAAALNTLADAMPPDYEAVVDLILASSGRVIVSGIGKSGHIGRKIAATLASTGTAAYFVHAAETSHGDMGLIAKGDICLMISNSGETSELRDLVAHTRRFSIPLIALSSRPRSALVQAADYRLLLPQVPEACPIGLAPTTSTTLTLALGDALAVSLMQRRGFVAADFKVLHPGGKLGAQLSNVTELMHTGADLPLVGTDADMSETLLTMTAKGFGIAGVVDQGQLIGVISDGDLRRNMADLFQHTAGQIANRTPVTVGLQTLAAEALALMNARQITAVLVVDDAGVPVGVLHLHDCLRAGVA